MKWTPAVSIVTIFLELVFLFLSFSSKRKKEIKIPSLIILVLLLSYQIVESLVCLNTGNKLLLSRIAFLLILWLPAVGLDLIISIIKKNSIFAKIYYIPALILSVLIILSKDFVNFVQCEVFWAKYQNSNSLYLLYSVYYELGQIGMIFLSVLGLVLVENKQYRIYLALILIGTIIFVLFGFMFVVIVPAAFGALPSVMCHFAVFLALILTIILNLNSYERL